MTLPEEFKTRMRAMLGEAYPAFIACYDEPPVRGLRVNTLKISADEFAQNSPRPLEKTDLLEEGFQVFDAQNVGKHPCHAAGLFYMQEPSAMSAVTAAGADGSGLFVLDMCAAPGGKTGGTAARMRGKGIVVANEIVPKRARLLAQNVERLGIPNCAVISERPDRIAEALPEFFDIVAVDAPCSGEGMFRKDEGAIAEWSPEHVASCAERQKLILSSSAECVSPGGAIVYSTCTFSREENEGVIEDFLNKHKDFSVELMERLYPHECRGEGHFVCRLRREGERRERFACTRFPETKDRAALAALAEFAESTLENGLPEGVIHLAGDRLRLIPKELPEALLRLGPVACGVELGELRKGRFVPSHSFFMASLGQKFKRELVLDADSREIEAFLKGNTLPCPDDWRGYAAVSVKFGGGSYPVGFGKAVDGVMKNHLPKGLYLN